MLHVLRSWLAGATELHDISWWMVTRRQQSQRLEGYSYVCNEVQPLQWQYKLPPCFVHSRQWKRETTFLSPLVFYVCNPPSKGCWPPASYSGDSLDFGTEISQHKQRDFHSALAIDKMNQIPWPLCQTLPKAHCLHLIGADALEGAGVPTSHFQSTRLSRFSELLTMDLFSLCRLMKLSEGPKILGVSCFEGHFSQLFNLFNHNLILVFWPHFHALMTGW